jgi:hypothetical protein
MRFMFSRYVAPLSGCKGKQVFQTS